jgi:hypothetical protein
MMIPTWLCQQTLAVAVSFDTPIHAYYTILWPLELLLKGYASAWSETNCKTQFSATIQNQNIQQGENALLYQRNIVFDSLPWHWSDVWYNSQTVCSFLNFKHISSNTAKNSMIRIRIQLCFCNSYYLHCTTSTYWTVHYITITQW